MSTQKRRYELRARADRQARTRARIVEATRALHQEIGPARTTIAEIARRAGVQRLTVYNHFPEESELFAACQASFLADHPGPELGPGLALADPSARVQATLRALYASYRDREPMTEKILRDRALVPRLDALMSSTMDAQMSGLADALAGGFRLRSAKRRSALRAVVLLALDFWTWQRLKREGLGDEEAADLMADLIGRTADTRSRRRAA